jgi:hypothetical protein
MSQAKHTHTTGALLLGCAVPIPTATQAERELLRLREGLQAEIRRSAALVAAVSAQLQITGGARV